ncbi:MAG: hypothetical protein KGZ83_02385 [Sulfuricella sp.]|nr:hypothetical protein [Sulfuricella sp.]
MTDISTTPLAKLEAHLLSPIVKGPTKVAGRIAFRGEFALKLAPSTAGEIRPPEVKADQVIIACEGGKISFFSCHVASLAHLELVMACLGQDMSATGSYYVFAGNLDISKKYVIDMNGIPFNVLPLDEATVYNELLDLFYLEKGDLKKMSGEEKIDAIVDAAAKFNGKFPAIPYAQAVAEMGPVKVAENRPV